MRRHAQYWLFTFLPVSSTFSSSGHALPTWSFDFPPHPRSNTHARTPREQRFKADDATQQRQRRNEATTATQRNEDDDATQQRQRRHETKTTTQRSKENDATKHRQPQQEQTSLQWTWRSFPLQGRGGVETLRKTVVLSVSAPRGPAGSWLGGFWRKPQLGRRMTGSASQAQGVDCIKTQGRGSGHTTAQGSTERQQRAAQHRTA